MKNVEVNNHMMERIEECRELRAEWLSHVDTALLKGDDEIVDVALRHYKEFLKEQVEKSKTSQ